MSDVTLEVESVGMRFGGLRALDDVSFDVERGAVVGLIGPKRFRQDDAHERHQRRLQTHHRRRALRRQAPHRRRADTCGLPSRHRTHVSDREAVRQPERCAKTSPSVRCTVAKAANARRARRSNAPTNCSRSSTSRAWGISAASDLTIPDRKRLEVAKALALDPDVLLLDEVMAGLNATEVDDALVLLRRVNERGVTLIVVEHLMKAIVSISTTIVVLAEGKKIAQGAARRRAGNRRT